MKFETCNLKHEHFHFEIWIWNWNCILKFESWHFRGAETLHKCFFEVTRLKYDDRSALWKSFLQNSAHSSSFGGVSCKDRPIVRVLKGSSSLFDRCLERNGSFHVQKDIEILDFWRMSRAKRVLSPPEAPPEHPHPRDPQKPGFDRRPKRVDF